MAKKDKGNSRKKSKKTDVSFIPFKDRYEEMKGQQVRPTEDATTIHYPLQNEKGKAISEEKQKRSFSDNITLWSFVANVILTIGTLVAIFFTYQSVQLTREAVDDNTKNFQLQNMPYLQAGGFKFKGDTLIFYLSNLGQYPAKIDTGKFGASEIPDINNLEGMGGSLITDDTASAMTNVLRKSTILKLTMKPLFDPTIINRYVVKDSPVEITYNGFAPFFIAMNGRGYLLGRFYYRDEVAGTKRIYQFVARLYGSEDDIKSEFLINDNPIIVN